MTSEIDCHRQPGAEGAYTQIRAQIMRGEQPGGTWLREGELATSLGVSRTPVREALRRLTAEGLVVHEHNKGARVVTWSVTDLDEMFSLRAVLEPWGCRQAAMRDLADIDLLSHLADEMDVAAGTDPPDVDRVTELNNRFHRHILEASGNARLLQLMDAVVNVPLVWRTFSFYSPARMQRSLAHHHELVDALRAHDGEWAESVMRSHVHAAHATLKLHYAEFSDS